MNFFVFYILIQRRGDNLYPSIPRLGPVKDDGGRQPPEAAIGALEASAGVDVGAVGENDREWELELDREMLSDEGTTPCPTPVNSPRSSSPISPGPCLLNSPGPNLGQFLPLKKYDEEWED